MENNPHRQQSSQEGSDPQGSSLKDKARAFKDKAQRWQRQATASTRRAAKATDVYVHESPWLVIAGVAVAGFAIGLLLRRKSQ